MARRKAGGFLGTLIVVGIAAGIFKYLKDYSDVLQIHGFYLNKEKKSITFDVVMDFSSQDPKKVYMSIFEKVHARYPEYTLHIQMDTDVSD